LIPGDRNVAKPIARCREARRAKALVRDASFPRRLSHKPWSLVPTHNGCQSRCVRSAANGFRPPRASDLPRRGEAPLVLDHKQFPVRQVCATATRQGRRTETCSSRNSGCLRSGPTGPACASGLVCAVATALAWQRGFWRASGAAGRRIQPVAPAPCASSRRRALGARSRGPRRSSRRLSRRS
jgi:hypothetical protein